MVNIQQHQWSKLFVMLRPYHWIKNTFVFAPMIFSGQFKHFSVCLRATFAFVCFCMVTSGIYIINDLFDRNEDQQHPVKKHRPIASGVISSNLATTLSIILITLGLMLGYFLKWPVVVTLLLYTVINIAYSLALKHIVILDVLIIAVGFVLRIIGGGLAISVVPSYWLILCTVMISIFLGFTKRRAELVSISTEKTNSRPALKNYSIAFLDQVISMVTGATIIAYALYTVDTHTQRVLGTRAMLITFPFVIYGIFRYIYLIYHLEQGEDPVETLINDIPTIINFLIWIVISLCVVNYGSRLNFL